MTQWDCRELARQLVAAGVVPSISADSVLRVLLSHGLRPWRVHAWLSPKVPRDAAFAAQPRKRKAPTLPAAPRQPVRVEHEYVRGGALHLFAAFDTRTGKVTAVTATRKCAVDFIRLLEELDSTVPAEKSVVHLVLDNVSVHKSKAVAAWLETHPRFVLHFPPVHCSWLNQVEQWFSILQRKALKAPNFADKEKLAAWRFNGENAVMCENAGVKSFRPTSIRGLPGDSVRAITRRHCQFPTKQSGS